MTPNTPDSDTEGVLAHPAMPTAQSSQVVHLDLFSGIGGFAYAIDQIWDNVQHIFCDNDPFCKKVLAKHWPESEIFDDIKNITKPPKADIVTGGFPCQPFSHAGKKQGSKDDRFLWPSMAQVIRLAKPEWVIAENVYGISTWDGGVVLEQVCLDLEALGYEVQPFIIPAVAVNAPHRRDRVWFIACNPQHARQHGSQDTQSHPERTDNYEEGTHQPQQPTRPDSLRATTYISWDSDWHDIAAELCRVDDGLPDRVDRIKGLGNSIVPQVVEQLIRGIDLGATDKEAK